MPTKTWVVGEEVLAADWNQLVQEQVVATFANLAARTTALPAPKPGMVTWLTDVKRLERFDGVAWQEVGALLGRLGAKFLAGNLGSLAAYVDLSAGGITVQAVTGRIYRAFMWAQTFSPGGAPGKSITFQINYKVGAAAEVALATYGTRVNLDNANGSFFGEYTHVTAPGPVTFLGVGGAEQASQIAIANQSRIVVDDVGHT